MPMTKLYHDDVLPLAKAGKTATEIAKKLDVTLSAVSQFCKREEIHLVRGQSGGALRIRPSKERLAVLRTSHTAVQIGKIFGVSHTTVEKWVRFYDLQKARAKPSTVKTPKRKVKVASEPHMLARPALSVSPRAIERYLRERVA